MNSIYTSSAPQLLAAAPLVLPMSESRVHAGFPSPAEDFAVNRLDLTQILITHSQATYIWKVTGESMQGLGIDDGDLLLVNRALRALHDDIVVATVDGEFTLKQLHQRPGRMRLKAGNPSFPDILPKDGQIIEIWGVATSSIKRFVVSGRTR